ncbi:MAG TPA: hypothetical protein VNO21_23080, partial [Polyangiaceae bacterium]|nr:hypothetical protein [Polyangiaceae bacterium]
PSWQPGTATRRTTADVSAVGFPSFAVFDSFGVGGWAVFGGTSLSSPIVAAIFALTGKGGSDASIIYRNTADFYDITSGTNRVRTSTRATYLNTAGVGYDGPTGIGTPNGAAFVSAQ